MPSLKMSKVLLFLFVIVVIFVVEIVVSRGYRDSPSDDVFEFTNSHRFPLD